MVETGNPYRDNVSRLITWGHWFSFFNIILAMLILETAKASLKLLGINEV